MKITDKFLSDLYDSIPEQGPIYVPATRYDLKLAYCDLLLKHYPTAVIDEVERGVFRVTTPQPTGEQVCACCEEAAEHKWADQFSFFTVDTPLK